MKKKKKITMFDLIELCSEKQINEVRLKNTKISLSDDMEFEKIEEIDEGHRGMTKVKVKVMHSGLNRKGFIISKEVLERDMHTIKNRPLLANVYLADDGNYEFGSHDLISHNDDNGHEIIDEYIEKEIGSFSEAEPFLEYNEERDIYFVCAYAYISNEYSHAAEVLINKKGHAKFSVEMDVEKMEVHYKENLMEVTQFCIVGGTLLGVYEGTNIEVKEGMEGACVDIVAFSLDDLELKGNLKYESKSNDPLNINTKEKCDNVSQIKSEKGGVNLEKFDELLKKYNITTEDVAFEYEGLSDDELIAKFEEVFSDEKSETTNTEKEKFSLSLNALYDSLENELCKIYERSYIVDVFDNRVIYRNYENYTDRVIKSRSYTVSGTDVILGDDETDVFVEYLSADEHKKLDEMRTNYDAMKSALEVYEAKETETKKKEIISKNEYSSFVDKEEFFELKENAKNYSLDEFEQAANKAFMNCVLKYGYEPKNNTKMNLSMDEPQKRVSKVKFNNDYDKGHNSEYRYAGLKFD